MYDVKNLLGDLFCSGCLQNPVDWISMLGILVMVTPSRATTSPCRSTIHDSPNGPDILNSADGCGVDKDTSSYSFGQVRRSTSTSPKYGKIYD